jgi:hypothetical protein
MTTKGRTSAAAKPTSIASADPVPAGLADRGSTFWTATTGVYDLSKSELSVLAEACRTMDQLDRLNAQVSADGTMIAGAVGQPVLHPAIGEARAQRVVLHRLLAALMLPDEGRRPDADDVHPPCEARGDCSLAVGTRKTAVVARLKQRPAAFLDDSAVPLELYDDEDPTWQSDEAAAAWHRRHPFRPSVPMGLAGSLQNWRQRRRRAVSAWAVANGIVSDRWPDHADYRRLRELGL